MNGCWGERYQSCLFLGNPNSFLSQTIPCTSSGPDKYEQNQPQPLSDHPEWFFLGLFTCSTSWPQKMIREHWLVLYRYRTAIEGACPQMAPGWWEIQSNSGERSNTSVTDPSTAAELICAGLSGVHKVMHFDYCHAWELLPLRSWILQTLLGWAWTVALKGPQQMRYSLFAASYTATEETVRTETVDSEWKLQQEQYLIMKEHFCIYMQIFLQPWGMDRKGCATD